MKYIFNYFTLLLLTSLVIVSCKRKTDNNGTTNLDKGVYISGTATVFTSIGAAATFDNAKLDDYGGKSTGAGLLAGEPAGGKGITSDPTVLGKYVWLKTGGSFTITISDATKVSTVYGKGTATTPSTNTRFTTYNMVKDATGFTVPETGLYFLIVCTQNNQITIAPAKWGITLGSGGAEIPMVVTPYNATTNDVVYTLTTDILKSATFKFRYSSDWGIGKIPFTTNVADSVTVHSDVASADGTLSNANYGSILVATGKDMSVGATANYTVYFKYNVANSVFSAYATNNGAPKNPVAPDNLYLYGGDFGGSGSPQYASAVKMFPSNSFSKAGGFWAIVWMKGSGTFQLATDATGTGAFGVGASKSVTDPASSAVETVYIKGTTAISEPTTAGYYMVTYLFNASGAGNDSISIKPAEIYLFGSIPPAHTNTFTWSETPLLDIDDKFTVSGQTFTSPAFKAPGKPRMSAYHRWIPNGWGSEFSVESGVITGNQDANGSTTTTAVTLDFSVFPGAGTVTP